MSQKLVLAPASTTVDNIVTFDTITGQIKDSGIDTATGFNVVQYVIGKSSSDDSTTTNVMSDTSLTASITPTNVNNKIFAYVFGTAEGRDNLGGSGTTHRLSRWEIYRSSGTPQILTAGLTGFTVPSSSTGWVQLDCVSLNASEDVPATSSQTYVLRFAISSPPGNAIAYLRGSTYGPALMLLMEVAL